MIEALIELDAQSSGGRRAGRWHNCPLAIIYYIGQEVALWSVGCFNKKEKLKLIACAACFWSLSLVKNNNIWTGMLPFLHSLFAPYCVSFADKSPEIVLHVVNLLPQTEGAENPQGAAQSAHSAEHNSRYPYA